jgi:hypothetical protein
MSKTSQPQTAGCHERPLGQCEDECSQQDDGVVVQPTPGARSDLRLL